MENLKWVVIVIFTAFQIIANVYTVIEGFSAGKIKVFSYASSRFLGEKPIREHSLNFEPTYFWLEVSYNMFWPVITPFAIYFLFF